MKRGTPVTVFGLKANTNLNGCNGTISSDWDGCRYSVQLSEGTSIRVTARNLAPSRVSDFVVFQERLMHELCIFGDRFGDDNSQFQKISMDDIAPHNPALNEKIVRARLSSQTGLLRLFHKDSTSPDVQLMPSRRTVTSQDSFVEFSVFAEDTLTAFSVFPGDELKTMIRVRCREHVVIYENLYPRFHLSIDSMRAYTTPGLVTPVVSNLIDLAHFKDGPTPPITFYQAEDRLLLFSNGKVGCKVISLQWPPLSFRAARRAPATNYKQRVLSFIESDATPALQTMPILPVGLVVTHKKKRTVVKEHISKTSYRLATEQIVEASDLVWEPISFLYAQLVFVGHMLEFIEQSHYAVNGPDAETPAHIELLREHISGMYHNIAESDGLTKTAWRGDEAMAMLKSNIRSPLVLTNLILPKDFLDGVVGSEKRLLAWYANTESLACAVSMVFSGSNATVETEGKNTLVVRCENRTVRVAAFFADPIEGQRIVFKRDAMEAREDDSDLLCTSVDLICKVFEQTKSEKPPATSQKTAAEIRRMNARAIELLLSDPEPEPSRSPIKKKVDAKQQAPVAGPEAESGDEEESALERTVRLQKELVDAEEEESVSKKKKKKTKAKKGKKKTTPAPAPSPVNDAAAATDFESAPAPAPAPVLVAAPVASDATPADAGFDAVSNANSSEADTAADTAYKTASEPSSVSGSIEEGRSTAEFQSDTESTEVASEASSYNGATRRTNESPFESADDDGFTVVAKSKALRMMRHERDDTRRQLDGLYDSLREAELSVSDAENRVECVEVKLCDATAEIEALKERLASAQLAATKTAECDAEEKTKLKEGLVAAEARLKSAQSSHRQLLEACETRAKTAEEGLEQLRQTQEQSRLQMQSWALKKLLAQLAFYAKQPHYKTASMTMSIELVLCNGIAAKNMIEFYRMTDPAKSKHSDHDVLDALAAAYPENVEIKADSVRITE